MEEYERSQIESLLDRDEELRALWQEHQDLESRLRALDSRRYLSPEEQVERKRLQKRKLAGKDRIAEIVARHATV
jgi:hypothetical protein